MTTHMKKLTARLAVCGVTVVALLTGCGLLDTETPDIIEPGQLDAPEGATARRLGAIGDFAYVMDGDGTQFEDGRILLSGLVSDEFRLSTTPPSEQDYDQRRISQIFALTLFLNLQRARVATEDAADALQAFSPDPDAEAGIPEMLSLAGFTYIAFGEDFCSGVPYSRLSGDELVFGDPQTTEQTFQRAIERFDAALAHPAITEELGYLASVGKARALLNLAQFDEAAQAVATVPTEFQYVTEHAETPLRLQNAIWSYNDGFLWSVSDQEGGNGLPFASAGDPRVPVFDTDDVGLDGQTPQVSLLKYGDATAPVVVADGVEARLIEAEALLQMSDFPGMTTILNDLRTDAISPPMPILAEPMTFDEAVDLLFSERAYWLFATGHRLGDLRRLIKWYARDSESVFPTGAYHKGGQYGPDVNIPIPIEERNNPNSQGCINRGA